MNSPIIVTGTNPKTIPDKRGSTIFLLNKVTKKIIAK